MKFVLIHIGDTMDPYEVKFHKATYDCVDPDSKKSKVQPEFDKVDNLGG